MFLPGDFSAETGWSAANCRSAPSSETDQPFAVRNPYRRQISANNEEEDQFGSPVTPSRGTPAFCRSRIVARRSLGGIQEDREAGKYHTVSYVIFALYWFAVSGVEWAGRLAMPSARNTRPEPSSVAATRGRILREERASPPVGVLRKCVDRRSIYSGAP